MKNLASGENILVTFMKNYIDFPLSIAKHSPIFSNVYAVSTPLMVLDFRKYMHWLLLAIVACGMLKSYF